MLETCHQLLGFALNRQSVVPHNVFGKYFVLHLSLFCKIKNLETPKSVLLEHDHTYLFSE